MRLSSQDLEKIAGLTLEHYVACCSARIRTANTKKGGTVDAAVQTGVLKPGVAIRQPRGSWSLPTTYCPSGRPREQQAGERLAPVRILKPADHTLPVMIPASK